jgi:hypothetical protein
VVVAGFIIFPLWAAALNDNNNIPARNIIVSLVKGLFDSQDNIFLT